MIQAPVSLYLDLEKGERANIEVVARTAIAWSVAVKELAFIVDPQCEIDIELISGSEGSLGLNVCVKAFSKIKNKHPQLATVIVASLAWFTLQTAQYTYEKVLDWLTGANAPQIVVNLTTEEKKNLAKDVAKILEKDAAGEQRQHVFRELGQDKRIVGVGATQAVGVRPSIIIPSSEFEVRSGSSSIINENDVKRRTRHERLDVILITPTLKEAERRWRFQVGSLPEFGATMRDKKFLAALSAGRVSIAMRTGVHMDIELETKEEMVGPVWEVRERNVIRVHSPTVIDDQGGLPFAS